jgi:hypothetical protein
MVVVAGPPGSGKTTRFPVAEFDVDSFNADNRAAQQNAGSFRSISKEIRSQVNVEFQKWILDHLVTSLWVGLFSVIFVCHVVHVGVRWSSLLLVFGTQFHCSIS